MTFISRDAERKTKNLEEDLSSCQEDLLSAERMKRAVQCERDDLFEENTTLLREKNQVEEEKEEVRVIYLYFLV